jgi:hypothetical protein
VEPVLRVVAASVLVAVAVRMALAARASAVVAAPTRDLVAAGGSAPALVGDPSAGPPTPATGGLRLASGFMGLTMVNPLTIVVYAGIVMSGGAGVGTIGWVLGMGLASLFVHSGFVGLGHVLGATVSERAITGLRWAASAFLVQLALHLLLA